VNEKKIVKFNLWMSGILLSLLVLVFVGGTIAYFFDTQQASSTFTSGNVKILLSESAVKQEGCNLVRDPDKPRVQGAPGETVINNYGSIYPGQTIYKDPTITNIGDNDEWIAAKVVLTDGAGDLTRVMGYEGVEFIDIEMLLSGGLLDETVHFGVWNGIEAVCYNDRYVMIQVPSVTTGPFEFIFLMLAPVAPGESVMLFDRVSFPKEWNNSEMQELASLGIHVQAYGVQVTSLNSCLQAMTKPSPPILILTDPL
jgi:predicted ribosomally synthesized peptide with SipW-like signal peptide